MRLKSFLPLHLLCLAVSAFAQDFPASPDPDVVQARRMATPPVLDGTINVDEWSGATTSSRSLVVIQTSSLSGDKGQYWIGYDDSYFYVAARIIMDNGGKINADEFRQNVSLHGNDAVTFLLDVRGTTQEFNSFTFNASGATQMQIAGGRAPKQEWLGKFDAAGRITAGGWEGEARIAWDLMPMPGEGLRDMKFIFDWYVSSKQLDLSFHSIQGDLSKMHTLQGVNVPKVDQSREILLLPYAYAGIGDNGGHIANAGLDVKTSITDDLNLVATFNPDFRNIENDILNLDFSNFERLRGETRPFFVEGSRFLQTGQVNNRRLFVPQRIGSFDTGINVYGRLNSEMNLGLLSTIDQGNQHTLAGEVAFSPNPVTSINGAFATLDRAGEENLAGSLEYFQRAGDYLLFAAYGHTDDEVVGIGNTLAWGTQYRARGLTGTFLYEQVSPNFNPRIGFAPERDFKGAAYQLIYSFNPSSGPIRQTQIETTFLNQDRFDRGHYRELGLVRTITTLRNGLGVDFSFAQDHFLTRYDTFWRGSLTYPRNDPYRGWRISHTRGDVVGKAFFSTTARVRYRPIKRLQLAVRYQLVDHLARTDQTILTFNWEMDKWQSVGGRVVGMDDKWNWFASYSRRGNLGAEYFLIVGDPNADSFQSSVILKVSVPLTIGG